MATTLEGGFIRHGHAAMLGTRSPEKLADWKAGSFADAAAFGEVLAVKGKAASDVLRTGRRCESEREVRDRCGESH